MKKPLTADEIKARKRAYNKNYVRKPLTSEQIEAKKLYNKHHTFINREYINERRRKWREKNKELQIKRAKTYREKNKEKLKKQNIEYNKTHSTVLAQKKKIWKEVNKDIIKSKDKTYREANKERHNAWRNANKSKINDQRKTRRKYDPQYNLKCSIRGIVWRVISRKGFKKTSRTHQILGCSFEEFKTHLESKFESWMNWKNKGLYNGESNHGWDIDHIIPLSTAKTLDDIIRLNHYSNLQPLCSYINRHIKKGSY